MKFSNFRQNHFSDFETPFSVGLTESVLALNRMERELEISVFYLVPKHFWSETQYVAHDPAPNVYIRLLYNVMYICIAQS